MTDSNAYIPDYFVSLGEVLAEYLDAHGMSQTELASKTGIPGETIKAIIEGELWITPEMATKFAEVLIRPAHFWNNMEKQSREDRERLAKEAWGARKPPPPEDLVAARQDNVHKDIGKARRAKVKKGDRFAAIREMSQKDRDEILEYALQRSDEILAGMDED